MTRKSPKRSSGKKKSGNDAQLIDAGGGALNRGANIFESGLAGRTDMRGAYGLGYDFPDPIQRPRERIRVVQLPGTIVYVPVPAKPPKKNKNRRSGGGGPLGLD